jgi:hypothetical protein
MPPPNRQPVTARASRIATEGLVGQLQANFTNRTWLAPTNRYVVDTINRLKTDTGNPPALIGADLAEYVAASAPLHLLDGWTFLGRSVDASLRGDPDTARHLAYYAELRAAMALLASEGLGVFDKKHFVIEVSRLPSIISPTAGTHQMVWELLEAWCKLPKAATIVGQVISVGGTSLLTWLAHFGMAPGNALQPVAADWLTTWGLDLRQLSHDREARNESSYRPSGLVSNIPAKAKDSFEAIRDLWRVLEPASTGRFEVLDSYLLRFCIEAIFKSVTSSTRSRTDRQHYLREVGRMIASVNASGDPTRLRAFLIRREERSDPDVLKMARKTDPPSAPDHHLQVLSRAALLLRIASGSCALLLQAGGTSLSQVHFWWSRLGEERGCWERRSTPQNVTDLWADIEEALEQLESKRSILGRDKSLLRWRQELISEVGVLGECERIGLWGINV